MGMENVTEGAKIKHIACKLGGPGTDRDVEGDAKAWD